MLFDTRGYRLFLRPGSVDFRKGSNSLAQLVEQEMELSPFDKCSYSCIQHRVHHLGTGARTTGPGGDVAVKTINHRRKIYFPGGNAELGDIAQPFLIWVLGSEIALEQILNLRAELSLV